MLWYIYVSIIALGIVLGITFWHFLSKTLKVSTILLASVLLIELLRASYPLFSRKLHFLNHLNTSQEFILLFLYYFTLLKKANRIYLYLSASFYIVWVIITFIFIPDFYFTANFLDSVSLAIVVTIWTMIFFIELIYKPVHYSLESDGNFWINCAHILFYPGTLCLFGLRQYINVGHQITYITIVLNLVLYALYAVALYIEGTKRRKYQLSAIRK